MSPENDKAAAPYGVVRDIQEFVARHWATITDSITNGEKELSPGEVSDLSEVVATVSAQHGERS